MGIRYILILLLTFLIVSISFAGESVIDEKGLTITEPLRLGIKDFIKLVREKNDRINYQQLEWEIASESVESARSIFEPEFVGSLQHEKIHVRNTIEEAQSRSALPEFNERDNNYNASIEGLVPTGGRLGIGYTLNDISNNLQDIQLIEKEYKSFLGANLTQPLLKNGGVMTTMATISVAEADQHMAFQTYRQEMIKVIAHAASAYWDLYQAQEKYNIRKESVRIAEQILKDNQERVKTGKMAETEVLEAEAGFSLRKSLEIAAEQDIVAAMNTVRSLLFFSAAEYSIKIEATDQLKMDRVTSDFEESLQTAFKLRPEYLSNTKKVEREGIRIAYAENQRWPQLDLKASYGLNGLDDSTDNSWSDAWDRDHLSWSVGIELRIPLGGGMKSRSELRAASYRKKQALLEVKATEVELANSVDTSIRNVQNVNEQVRHYRKVVSQYERLLEVELMRFKAGKSNSRLVLEREETLNKAREDELESLVKYKKAVLQLEMAEGSLLQRHDVEVMEGEK